MKNWYKDTEEFYFFSFLNERHFQQFKANVIFFDDMILDEVFFLFGHVGLCT